MVSVIEHKIKKFLHCLPQRREDCPLGHHYNIVKKNDSTLHLVQLLKRTAHTIKNTVSAIHDLDTSQLVCLLSLKGVIIITLILLMSIPSYLSPGIPKTYDTLISSLTGKKCIAKQQISSQHRLTAKMKASLGITGLLP